MLRKKPSRRFSSRIEYLESRLLLAGNSSIIPVSISVGGSDTGNDASSGGSVSADGRYIAFTSEATNLVSGQSDTPNSPDVFLFDTETQAITLVSHASGTPSTTGDGFSYAAVVSADGNFVVYYSTATNLVDGQVDNNNGGGGFLDGNDIFLFNRQTGETQLVSRVAGSTNITGNVASGNSGFAPGSPAISSDGRYVAFVSQASDLTPLTSDFNGTADVFLFDATANTVQLISRSNSSALVTADGASLNPIISANGRFVAYTSSSSDLVEGQVEQNGSWDLFLFDRDAVEIPNRLVSGTNGSATLTASGVTFSDLEMDLSDDGQFLVFKSFATDLVSGATDDNNNSDIFLFNRLEVPGSNITFVSHATGLATTAATGGSASSETPTISGDGRFVAYKSTASNIVTGDSNSAYDVFLFDRVGSGNTLVSHAANSTASANGVSSNPRISGDGNFVAFASNSTNVVTGQVDLNGVDDVFLFDRTTGTTALVSGAAGSASATANQTSVVADINLDGQGVVFLSSAANLTGVDTNGQQDVFSRVTLVPTFAFRSESFIVQENGVTARIRVDRTGDTTVSAAVDYLVGDNTAIAGVDFQGVEDTLVFAPGETSLTFDVSIVDDGLMEGDELVLLTLFGPSPGSVLGSPSLAALIIKDNDGLELISVNSGGTATANHGSDFSSADNIISDDGRFVAFSSYSTDLVSGMSDTNEYADVFLRDRFTGQTVLVSRNASGTASGNNISEVIDISANGLLVLFKSRSTDLVAGMTDNNASPDLFVFNAFTGQTTLVSGVDASTVTGNDISSTGRISADGRFVVFESLASNLVSGISDTNQGAVVYQDEDRPRGADIFLRDLTSGTTTLVSRVGNSNSTGNSESLSPQISGDGRYVAFISAANDLVAGISDNLVSGSSINAQFDENDLFVWDRLAPGASAMSLVTVNESGTATANGKTDRFDLSRDGLSIVFETDATDLVAGVVDNNQSESPFEVQSDIYYRDLTAGTTRLVSHSSGSATATANRGSLVPILSDDGRFVLFTSPAINLVTGLVQPPFQYVVPSLAFRYSIEFDTTELVSVSDNEIEPLYLIDGIQTVKAITSDGRFVAFSTYTSASLAVPGITDLNDNSNFGSTDLFLRDMLLGTTTLISGTGPTTGNQSTGNVAMSANGKFLVFENLSMNLGELPDVNFDAGHFLTTRDIFISPGAFEPGTFQFDDIEVAVSEDGGTALLTITRTGGSNGSFVLFFSTSSVNGTATQNQDYSTVSSSVQFLDGETSVTIGIPILDDGRDEINETFTITLSDGGLGLIGSQATATVTIVDQDTAVVGNQVIESDGDIVTVSLKGPGTFSLTLDDPDGNGKGPLLVALAGTNASSSILTFTVTKKNGDGFADVGEITGNSGLKGLAGANVNLTGSGLSLTGTVLTLALHDVLNGADITLGGSASDFIKMTLHKVEDNTTMMLGSGVKTLTAARIGRGNIFGTSIQTLSIKGDSAGSLRGDMFSNIYLSGQGIASGKNTLNKVTISHAMTDAIFSVYSGAGGIGTITAGRMVRSGISAGYTPTNFSIPLTGGTFSPALNIKTVTIKGLAGEGPAFTNSLIGAKTVGTVALASVDLTTSQGAMEDYGVIADISIAKVTVKSPAFNWNKSGPADQSISRFHVKVI